MIMSFKQKKIKFKPRIKLNHNRYIYKQNVNKGSFIFLLILVWLVEPESSCQLAIQEVNYFIQVMAVILACELTDSIVRDIATELSFSSFLSVPFISPEPIGKGPFTGDGNV